MLALAAGILCYVIYTSTWTQGYDWEQSRATGALCNQERKQSLFLARGLVGNGETGLQSAASFHELLS